MIDTHSMMSGYHVLQGSLLYHIPMFIAMVVFIRLPDRDYLNAAFPDKGQWAINWYWIALGLHLYLAFLQLAAILGTFCSDAGKRRGGRIQIMSTLGTIAQVFNLCAMLHLYSINVLHGQSLSFPYNDFELEAAKRINKFEEFKLWMLFEILVVLSTIGTSIVYLFQRTLIREAA